VNPWPEPVERVASVLREAAVDARVEEFSEGTPTAGAAARAAGCKRAEIVKSLVFVCDERPVLALVPGDKRVDAARLSAAAGARYARVAKPDEVRSATGFEPGGVAPFPAPNVARVLMDRNLLRHELVWIGAGSERHMAELAPQDLARLAKAEIGDLTEP
jgi:Cys-tRNA(Pro) deacylase